MKLYEIKDQIKYCGLRYTFWNMTEEHGYSKCRALYLILLAI